MASNTCPVCPKCGFYDAPPHECHPAAGEAADRLLTKLGVRSTRRGYGPRGIAIHFDEQKHKTLVLTARDDGRFLVDRFFWLAEPYEADKIEAVVRLLAQAAAIPTEDALAPLDTSKLEPPTHLTNADRARLGSVARKTFAAGEHSYVTIARALGTAQPLIQQCHGCSVIRSYAEGPEPTYCAYGKRLAREPPRCEALTTRLVQALFGDDVSYVDVEMTVDTLLNALKVTRKSADLSQERARAIERISRVTMEAWHGESVTVDHVVACIEKTRTKAERLEEQVSELRARISKNAEPLRKQVQHVREAADRLHTLADAMSPLVTDLESID